jgi:hypothetical protein
VFFCRIACRKNITGDLQTPENFILREERYMKKKLWERLFVVMAAIVMCLSISYRTEAAGATRTGVTATVMTDKDVDKVESHTYSFTKSDLISVKETDKYGMIIPITVDKIGDLNIQLTNYEKQSYVGVYAALFSDSTCKARVGSEKSNMKTGDVLKFTVTSTGVYYLAVYGTTKSSSEYSSFTNTFAFKAYVYRADSYTLTAGQTYANASQGSDSRYYQITVPKTEYVIISGDSDLSFDLCNSSKSTLYSSSSGLNSTNGRKLSFFLDKGTYYIRTKGASSGASTIRYDLAALGSADYTLKSGKTVEVRNGSDKTYTYLKFKAPSNGYLKLTMCTASKTGYVALCNAKRSPLSKDNFMDASGVWGEDTLVYGLQKGKTYYIRVRSSYTYMQIKAAFKSVTEKSGSKQSKAVKIKSGKSVKGLIIAGSSTADWYKFTLSKSKTITVNVKGNTNSKLHVVLYNSKGKAIASSTPHGSDFSVKLKTSGKQAKGTYYIKVERYDKYASGNYTLSYK